MVGGRLGINTQELKSIFNNKHGISTALTTEHNAQFFAQIEPIFPNIFVAPISEYKEAKESEQTRLAIQAIREKHTTDQITAEAAIELDDNPLSKVNLETIVSREIQKYKKINDQKINRLNQQIIVGRLM